MDLNGFGFDGFPFGGENKETEEQNFSGQGFNADWGLSLESFFGTPDEKTNKGKKKTDSPKDTSKKNGKKESKKGSNGKDEEVKLPVTVTGRGFEKIIEGSGVLKLSDVAKRLIEEGYHQFEIPGMALYYVEDMKQVFVVDGKVNGADDDTAIDLSDGKSITVIDGLLTATFTADDFLEKEEDEITAGVQTFVLYLTNSVVLTLIDFGNCLAHEFVPYRVRYITTCVQTTFSIFTHRV